MLATIAAGVMALVLALVIPVRADTKDDTMMIRKHPAVCAMPIEAIGTSLRRLSRKLPAGTGV